MKKTIVTGGKGFIGSHLIKALQKRDYNPVSFDIEDGQDITNCSQLEEFIKLHRPQVVFNLAALLGTSELIERDTERALDINTGGIVNILKLAKKYDFDVVEIGKPNIWLNTYSITKRAAEDFTKMYVKEYGVNARIVKWFNIFGPGQHYGGGHPQKLAPTTIIHALRGDPIEIFEDGEQTADHIYVEDAANAAIDIYECPSLRGRSVEVGSGEEMKINWFVNQVIKVTGSKSKIKYVPMRRGEDKGAKIKADITTLRDEVGFKPEYTFLEGLKKTIDYYKEHLEEFDKIKS